LNANGGSVNALLTRLNAARSSNEVWSSHRGQLSNLHAGGRHTAMPGEVVQANPDP